MACTGCFEKFTPFVGQELAHIYSDHVNCTTPMAYQPASIRDMQRVQKNRSNRFSKRRRNLLKKANDLRIDCEVDVYLCIRSKRNNKIWQYSSGFAPPSMEDMANLYPLPVTLGPSDFKTEKSYGEVRGSQSQDDTLGFSQFQSTIASGVAGLEGESESSDGFGVTDRPGS